MSAAHARWVRRACAAVGCASFIACERAPAPKAQPRTDTAAAAASSSTPLGDHAPSALPSASAVGAVAQPPAQPSPRAIGPYELPFAGKRNVYFVIPPVSGQPSRLIGNLHGMCNPPGYSCGYWTGAASERGYLVCPTGNATCGPQSYDAPTWTIPFDKISDDLEAAISVVSERYPGEVSREGAILTGFSMGASAAARIAAKHPGLWPYLILIEANVQLSVPLLKKAQVRAVALVAGERGMEIGPMKATAEALARQGYPARFWGMPKAGHWYSANIDQIMREAMQFLIESGEAAPDASAD